MFDRLLLLIRGLPGSGKTTLAESIRELNHRDCTIHSADDYFVDDNGVYRFDPNKLRHAHAQCEATVNNSMRWNTALVLVHNTFTRDSEMMNYYALAELHGYTCKTIICENRHEGESIHGVPSATLEKMRDRFSIQI